MKFDSWHRLREKRNKFLVETDKFMLPDFPITGPERAKYREYRNYLRNIPKMYNEETIKTAKVKTFDEWRAWKNGGEY